MRPHEGLSLRQRLRGPLDTLPGDAVSDLLPCYQAGLNWLCVAYLGRRPIVAKLNKYVRAHTEHKKQGFHHFASVLSSHQK